MEIFLIGIISLVSCRNPSRSLPAVQRRCAEPREKENPVDDHHDCDCVHRVLDTVQCHLLLVLAGQGRGAEAGSAPAEAAVSVCVHEFVHESDCVRFVQYSASDGRRWRRRQECWRQQWPNDAHELGEWEIV